MVYEDKWAIDPALQSTVPGNIHHTPSPAQDDQSPLPKKVRGIIPGSAADFRRREANRLAAERSRSRQHERVIGLELAAKTASEETVRLKEEISRLEGDDGTKDKDALNEENQIQEKDQQAQDAQQAQDSHSRTILAALMSEVDEAFPVSTGDTETDEASWMQGVESIFKEAESSGRLGELASVAAGQGDETVSAIEEAVTQHQNREVDLPTPDLGEPSIQKERDYDIDATAVVTASLVAIAVNAEMEKRFRDELARTKAATARIERDIARFEGHTTMIETEEDMQVKPSLPDNILSNDADILQAKLTGMLDSIQTLEATLPVQREAIVQIRDARIEDEKTLATAVHELQAMSLKAGEVEKAKIDAILGAMGGFVGLLLGGVQGALFVNSKKIPIMNLAKTSNLARPLGPRRILLASDGATSARSTAQGRAHWQIWHRRTI